MPWPIPQITDENGAFWTGGRDGELLIARCTACGFWVHPPTPRCPQCLSDAVEPRAVSGRGTVYSFTINRQAWVPDLEVPYVIAIVELDEQPGLRLMTNIVDGTPEEVEIGMPVEVAFVERGEAFIPVFHKVGGVTERFEDRCIVSGLGQSDVGRKMTKGVMDLTLDAVLEAIGDAGLKPADIDGVVSWPGAVTRNESLAPSGPGGSGPGPHAVIDALRLQPTWYYGGPETPGMFAAVIHACMAVATGMCRHVVVYRALNEATAWRTVTDRVSTDAAGRHGPTAVDAAVRGVLRPHVDGHVGDAPHARVRDDARAVRGHRPQRAAQRPAQPEGRPAGRPDDGRLPRVEDDQRPAVPVRLRHRGRRRHGTGHLDRGSRPGRPDDADPDFEAVGSALHGRASWDQWEDMAETAAASAGEHLWSRTDLKPADVDVANLYDGFSVLTLFWLEGLGFCGKGESGPFVEGGERIALDGELPLATSGGQLSAGRLHGFGHLYEACLQLRGQAEDRQVEGAKVAATSAGAGPLASCLLLRTDA